jgi:hypothetical protein
MIASLASRNLIEQAEGQRRLTRTAMAIIKGEAKPEEVSPSPLAADDTTDQAATPTSAAAPLVTPAGDRPRPVAATASRRW